MRVHVDEPRYDRFPGTVDGFVRDQTVRLGIGQDTTDPLPVDENVHLGAFMSDVLKEDHGREMQKTGCA